jgi:signal transduction histidine kinase/CheY-like chemotaxis protein
MLRDQVLGRAAGFTASNALSQSTVVTPDITTTAEPTAPGHAVSVSCARPELVSLAVADGATVVDIDQADFVGSTVSEVAKTQLRALCERIQGNVAGREGTALRAQAFLDIGGRRLSVVTVAADGFEAVNGQVSEAVAALVVVLVAVICGTVVYVSMAAMIAAERRERLKQKEAEARLKVARTVHHTTVSYLAHEMRGGLSVSSIGAGLAAEGLREDGLRLTNGDVVPPELLLGADATLPPLDEADDGVFGAVSSVGLLRDLQRIQAASASSLRLIEDVLDIVGLETGKLSVKLSLLSPAHFIYAIADRYRPISAVPIRLDVGAGVPANILSDPLRCEQAVLNGLTNAIKHSKTGAIVVSLRVETIRMPKSWHRVRSKGLNFFEQAAANADSADEDDEDEAATGEAGGIGQHGSTAGRDGPGSAWGWLLSLLSCCCCCAVPTRQAPSLAPPASQAAGPGQTPEGASIAPGRPRRRSSDSSGFSDLTSPIFAGVPGTRSGAAPASRRGGAGRTRGRALQTQAPYLVVRIIDNGGGLGGIDPEQLLRPFVSDKKAITRGGARVRSTGLGLPIAAQVAELIGGRVSLADDGDGHTVYTVLIPLIPPRRLIADMEEGFAGYRVGHELWRLLETGRAGEAAALLESEAPGVAALPRAAETGADGSALEAPSTAAGIRTGGPALEAAAVSIGLSPTADAVGAGQVRSRPGRLEALQEHASGVNGGETPPNHAADDEAMALGEDATAIPVSSSAVGIAMGDPASLVQASPVIRGGRTLINSHPASAIAGADDGSDRPVIQTTSMAAAPAAGTASTPPGKRADRKSRQARREQRQAERKSRRGTSSSSLAGAADAAASTPQSSASTSKPGDITRSLSVAGSDADSPLPAVAPGCGVLRGRGAGPLQGMFVLCVDDEPMVLASTTRLLRRLGCHVVAVQNPLEVDAILEFSGQFPPRGSSSDAAAGASSPIGEVTASGGSAPHALAFKGSRSGHDGGSGSLTPRSAASAPTGWTIGRGMAHGPASAVLREARPSGPGVGRFTCVFMDVIMPQRNGDEIASDLRHRGFRGPIVAVTGNIAVMDIRKYSACGFNGVLGKPLDRDILLSLLETLGI